MSVPLEGAVELRDRGQRQLRARRAGRVDLHALVRGERDPLARPGLGLALAPEDAQAGGAALRHLDVARGVALARSCARSASRSWCCRARCAPPSGSSPRPDWMDSATRCWRETGFCELSSIVIRLSGRTLNTVPSAKRISAAAPEPVRTRSFCRSTTASVARQPLERSRRASPARCRRSSRSGRRSRSRSAGGGGGGVRRRKRHPADRREQDERSPPARTRVR